jgi:hypothetical protein
MIKPMQFSQRIKDLAERDPERRLFGSQLHNYELLPCLTESELDALESSYGIEVPPEYRVFVSGIGNGGAGPGYGLQPLRLPIAPAPPRNEKMRVTLTDENGKLTYDHEFEDVGVNYDPDGSINTTTVKESFPLTAPFRSITDEMWDIQIPNWDERLRSQHESNKNAFKSIDFGRGVLKITHYGSGVYAVLVVNGPFRGQVWLTDPHMGDYVPASMRTDLHDSTVKTENAYALYREPFTFISWYSHWLDSAIRELEREYHNDS